MPMRRANRSTAHDQLVAAAYQFLVAALPPDYFITVFPAGGGGKVRGAKLKAMGLVAGVPDLMILAPPDARYYGVEIKTGTGRLSKAQLFSADAISRAGGHAWDCRNLEDVEACCRAWGFPCSAHVMPSGAVRRVAA